MTDILAPHIAATPGILGGKPHIAGHRISVGHVSFWHEKKGWRAEKIANQFMLTLAEVHAALAYYYDHRAEIEAFNRYEEAQMKEMKKNYPSLLTQRRKEKHGG